MSKKALVPINVLASGSEPVGRYVGDLYFNSEDKTIYAYDGTGWNSSSGGNLDGGMVDSNFGGINPIDGGGIV